MNKLTSVQLFKTDRAKINKLVKVLEDETGAFISQRVAIMIAVSKMLKEKTK